MNAWTFVYAAYAVGLLATAALVALSWHAMRSAEGEAERLGRD